MSNTKKKGSKVYTVIQKNVTTGMRLYDNPFIKGAFGLVSSPLNSANLNFLSEVKLKRS